MQLTERQRQLAACAEVPLLRLHAASRLPVWGFGLLAGGTVLAALMTPALGIDGASDRREAISAALFFAATFTLLFTFVVPVYRGLAGDLRALAPILPLPAEDLECLALGLTRALPRQLWISISAGLSAGAMHCYLLGYHTMPPQLAIPEALATLALWVVMVATLSKLRINATLFAKLGRHATPDLLRPSSQAPFGSAAIRPALFIISILCAYPLLAFGSEELFGRGVWLAFGACVASLFTILAMPLIGIRERIQGQRRDIIAALDARLEALQLGNLAAVSPDELRDIDTLLDMRERVAQAPGWPLDFAGIKRILLYVVLPPLTWAAAALVEMAIDDAIT